MTKRVSKKPIELPENQRIIKTEIKVKHQDNSIETHQHGAIADLELAADLDRFRATKFLKVSGDIVKKVL